jgi:hypothetical protein
LNNRILDFHSAACRLIGNVLVATVVGIPDQLSTDGYVSDDARRPEDRGLTPSASAIENTVLAFPSAIQSGSKDVQSLRRQECRLRRGKANDTLGRVRETLSGLSFQYINKVRQSSTTREHLRSFDGIKALSKEVSFYQQVYNRCSRALATLDPDLKRRYPPLSRSDCGINKAIADVNGRGQSQVRLAWFWGCQDGWDSEKPQQINIDNDRLMECKSFSCIMSLSSCSIVYRVSWMRARAQKNRWEEELPRTEREMVWTTRYFMYQRDLWYGRLCQLRPRTERLWGHEAYCEEKISHWEELARIAAFQFRAVNSDFPETWRPIVTVS